MIIANILKSKLWKNLAFIALILGGVPFIVGYMHIGNISLVLYGVLILSAIKISEKNHKGCNLLWVAALIATVVGIIFMAVLLHSAYFNSYNKKEPATVVVMGCAVIDGNPSLMLSARLNTAISLLKENPDYQCIVTGGLSEGEPFSEGEVMQRYLVENGIDSDRIHIESKATSTEENIAFSSKIISDYNLPNQLIIVTDSFHQFRSNYYAEQLGFESYSKSSLSGLLLISGYYVREMIAIIEMLTFNVL